MNKLPSITKIVEALNHAKHGSRFLRASVSANWNEITLKLFESRYSTVPSATSYIDRGHTKTDREAASNEAIYTAACLLRFGSLQQVSTDDALELLKLLTNKHNIT